MTPSHTVSVLTHWRSGDPTREHLWEQVQKGLPKEWEIITADTDDDLPYRGRSLNQAAQKARGDVLLIQDADKLVSQDLLHQAAQTAWESGVLVYTIDSLIYENEDGSSWRWPQPRDPAAITREAFWRAGGFSDTARFCEDEIFELCCSTLLGRSAHLGGVGRHPYHPPADRHDYIDSHWILEAYRAASGDPEKIRHLQTR